MRNNKPTPTPSDRFTSATNTPLSPEAASQLNSSPPHAINAFGYNPGSMGDPVPAPIIEHEAFPVDFGGIPTPLAMMAMANTLAIQGGWELVSTPLPTTSPTMFTFIMKRRLQAGDRPIDGGAMDVARSIVSEGKFPEGQVRPATNIVRANGGIDLGIRR